MKNTLHFLLLLTFFMTGCYHTSQKNLLSKAESFLPLNPDSTDFYLHLIEIRQLKDEEKALFALLRFEEHPYRYSLFGLANMLEAYGVKSNYSAPLFKCMYCE